ncbi:hypothetical protein MtrunA17_Chr3g0085631 [Medicago truncatula]|uniref:Uncharacterized protein n=1 Tax=Medicago truncatula TaxID=3880 RepID=A0A396IMC2_MEDTR|nr:hypothetical protein MtrunA17_Chr3g0085631 [Medicago truncatula]
MSISHMSTLMLAIFAYIYDFSPYDSMILNMVSERYPREEDDDASAFDSDIDEDEESDDAASASAIPETSSSHDRIVFGSFESPITPVSTPVIEPEFDGFSIKIGEISCALVTPCCNMVNENNYVFVDSQEDEKLEILEPELTNCDSDFFISDAPEVLVTMFPVRLCRAVYAVSLFALWLFVEKQSEQPVSAINNQLRFLQLHDESIINFSIPAEELVHVFCSLFTQFSDKSNSVCGGYLGIEGGIS